MSNKKNEKLTIEKILEKKRIIETEENKPYYSEFFGAEIVIENHPLKKVSEIVSKDYGEDSLRADFELIYAFCPIFRNKKLHEEYEVQDPIDIIELVFNHNLGAIQDLAKAILKRYGLEVDKVQEIKKQ